MDVFVLKYISESTHPTRARMTKIYQQRRKTLKTPHTGGEGTIWLLLETKAPVRGRKQRLHCSIYINL